MALQNDIKDLFVDVRFTADIKKNGKLRLIKRSKLLVKIKCLSRLKSLYDDLF